LLLVTFAPGVALPPRGPFESVPPVRWYYATLRLPTVRPARFFVVASRYRPSANASLPCGSAHPPGQGSLFTRLPMTAERSSACSGGDDRASQVPEGPPLHTCAGSRDPGGAEPPGHGDGSVLPSAALRASASTISAISGLDSRAHVLAVYASQAGLAPTPTQDSLPAGGQPLPGGGQNPARSQMKFQPHLHGFLLIQAFATQATRSWAASVVRRRSRWTFTSGWRWLRIAAPVAPRGSARRFI
jgi:hypothetical protein